MDNLILEGVVRILDRSLRGCSLLRWDRLGETDYLLRFATAAGDNLRVSLAPPQPAFFRLPHRDTPKPLAPDFFSGVAAQELKGAMLVGISHRGCDRVVEMDWETPSGDRRRLIAELIGKSANLLLLDSRDRVVAFARKMASAFRAPEEGQAYQPPVPRPGLEGATLDPDQVQAVLAGLASDADIFEAAHGFLRSLSPVLGADFPHRPRSRQDPVGEVRAILSAVQSNAFEAVLYSARPPAEMLLRPGAGDRPVILSPFPLVRPPGPVATPCTDCETASRLATAVLVARHRAQSLLERISGCLHKELARREHLLEKLAREQEESRRAETHQRFADLILATPGARVQGGTIVVPDLYGAEGAEVVVPADPALTPRQNAEKHYAKARKLRRGVEKIAKRTREVEAQRGAILEWRSRLQNLDHLADLEALEAELQKARVLPAAHGESRRGHEKEAESDPGVRKFRTEDGFLILVGRTARDNDRLTFHVASPHDFWFHAVDRSGAHVVVRNPGRLGELPREVALSAARIAAHFSRARGKGKAEVHYTLRKYVRKPSGSAPGLVTIRNHKTLEVQPGIPGGEKEGD
ncbi:MAG TPA: NFACT family protein [Candidatus Polarisedimenticolia bacterium]|nr:NFACT family protein [Candidatus Polarisedimenticolia bacterium]